MNLITLLLLGAALALGGFLFYVTTRPDTFSVQRTASFTATPATLFLEVSDPKHFQSWSPWAKLDPNCEVRFEGESGNPGSTMHWSGNGKVGAGSMTLLSLDPDREAVYRLVFLKPFKGTNTVTFSLESAGDATQLTWAMTGPATFLSKLMGVFMDCEKMCGDAFEQGFSNLREKRENTQQSPVAPSSPINN